MRQSAFRVGVPVFALWVCTLPAAPESGIRVAQAAQNLPPARTPRTPAAAQITPAPTTPSGEHARAQSAAQANQAAAQAPTPPQIPIRASARFKV
jgi:hypothetical protein